MNEDIKILESECHYLEELGYLRENNHFIRFNQALENLIKTYKELEEENRIIKGNYYTLCADIQMVTSELGFPEDTIIADEMVSMIKENYIPVSSVKEKIEEINRKIKNEDNEKVIIWLHKQRKILQELLEKRK